MHTHKRVLLIVALAVLMFAAIAVGPVYKRTVNPVRAEQGGPAVVLLYCSTYSLGNLPAPTLNTWSVSDPTLILTPALTVGESCSDALESVFRAGFSRLDAMSTGGSTWTVQSSGTTTLLGVITVYTLVRGAGPWTAH